MTETNQQRRNSIHDTRQRLVALAYRLRFHALRRPLAAVGAVLAVGVLLGAGGRSVVWDGKDPKKYADSFKVKA